ncbi:hypothetical protein K493DRAFT_341003, partial [Basidiobolus meristosporus CBS 931.73]
MLEKIHNHEAEKDIDCSHVNHSPKKLLRYPPKIYLWLFAFQLFNTWCDRLYEFGSYLFIMHVFKDTLLPSSVYGFALTGVGIVLSSWVGKWVDYVSRRTAVAIAIPTKRMSIGLMCLGFWFLSRYDFSVGSERSTIYGVFGAIVFFACVLKVATISLSIAVDRDWIVILTKSDSSALTTVNTNMRRIDLISKIVTPLFFGFLSSSQGNVFCVVFVGFWSLASAVPELLIIKQVYTLVPELAYSKVSQEHNAEKEETVATIPVLSRFYQGWLSYINHPVFASSLSYAMIYMSVLSIAGTMVSYLSWKGYPESLISVMRSLMAVLALIGTFVMPIMKHFLGVYRTAKASIWIEVITLIPVIISFFLPQNLLSAILLFGGISLSRLGVWVFDLSQTQIMQERVDNAQAGLINGWQYSLTNVFDLGQFLLTMIWSDPNQFHIPAIISFAMVVLAAITFTFRYHRIAKGTTVV